MALPSKVAGFKVTAEDGGDQSIETVNQGSSGYEGLHSLFFTTKNCAFSDGCTPQPN
jgi:hypothetical protein